MKKLQLLAVGDLHWAALRSIFPNTWLRHTTAMLNQATLYAVERGIKHIFLTGDIFNESEPSQETLKTFFEYFVQHKDIHFVLYTGNHDIKDAKINSLQLFCSIAQFALPNCTFITEPTVLTLAKHKIVVLPWPHTKLPKNSEGAKLGFAHVLVNNSLADNSRKLTTGIKLSRKVFWIIGDGHKRQKTKHYLYPGAPLQLNFQDSTKRYFDVVTLGDKVAISKIQFQSTYKLLTKTLTKPSDFEFLKAPNCIWRIYADYDIFVPQKDNIKIRLPVTKAAKSLTKDVTKGMDKTVVVGQIPTITSYLKNMGYPKPDRYRMLTMYKSLSK
jgi:hypothetical protein